MKALLTNYHQSPQKVRLVADLIRGKSVANAKATLMFMPKKSSPAIEKLLDSAVANARHAGMPTDNLFVKMIQVNKGQVLGRFMPRARGRAAKFKRTMSIISLELGAGVSAKAAKTAEKAAVKKAAAKKAAPRAKKIAKTA